MAKQQQELAKKQRSKQAAPTGPGPCAKTSSKRGPKLLKATGNCKSL